MHGFIVSQLRNFATARHGRTGWLDVERQAGVAAMGVPKLNAIYPDELVVALVVAIATREGVDATAVLRDFGAYLAPSLLRVYEPLIRRGWGTLDVVENVEEHIHTVVRLRDSSAGPPYLAATRQSPKVVEVVYTSVRRLCPLAEGIVDGIAASYGETVTVHQPECMLRGDARCVLIVELRED